MTDKSEEIHSAIAQRVHHFRKQNTLSFDELAKRADISKGMLVQIEKGRANPSIGILCKLASALGVSVADIVNIASSPTVTLIQSSDMPILWRGDKGGSAKLLGGTQGPKMIELWRWDMQPSERFDAQAHSRGTTEIIHVESGTLTVTIGSDIHEVGIGSALVALTDVPHSYANTSKIPVIFTMTVYEDSRTK